MVNERPKNGKATVARNGRATARKAAKAPKPGSTLERTYKGQKIAVKIGTDGTVKWAGKTYTSLTATAKAVTGYSSISGPAFFGMV